MSQGWKYMITVLRSASVVDLIMEALIDIPTNCREIVVGKLPDKNS